MQRGGQDAGLVGSLENDGAGAVAERHAGTRGPCQSRMREKTSAPITRAFLWLPEAMNLSAIPEGVGEPPAQTAWTSKAVAPFVAELAWIRQAVLGKMKSGSMWRR